MRFIIVKKKMAGSLFGWWVPAVAVCITNAGMNNFIWRSAPSSVLLVVQRPWEMKKRNALLPSHSARLAYRERNQFKTGLSLFLFFFFLYTCCHSK